MTHLTQVLALLLALLLSITNAEQPSYETVSIVQSRHIKESSGVAFSHRYPDAVWTHNDSGGKPYLYLVSTTDGKTVARVDLPDSVNRDWEDIASFELDGKFYLVVADVGDNLKRRDRYQLCLLEEPVFDRGDSEEVIELELSKKQWVDLSFRYPKQAHNCESIGVDLENRRFILTEKVYQDKSGPTEVFELPILLDDRIELIANPIAELKEKNFSAMDISRDGLRMVLRAYHAGYFLIREPRESWEDVLQKPLPDWIELPMHLQGEGVCFYPDGQSVLLSSEKKNQPLYKVRVPKL